MDCPDNFGSDLGVLSHFAGPNQHGFNQGELQMVPGRHQLKSCGGLRFYDPGTAACAKPLVV
jgi:hypothetical protein